MKKRIISLLLVIVMMISTSVTSTAVYFSDITTNIDDETFNAINYMADNGYMNGTSTGIFNPDLNVTRGMFVFLLYVYSKDNGTYTNPYTDVSSSQYYYNAVGWADANDITSGTTETTFSPNRVLTREQCICMLYNYAISNELDFIITDVLNSSLCDDYDKVTAYAKEAMNWAINQKIIQVENRNLSARENVTRANMALYVHRYEIYIKKLVFGVDTFSFENTPEDFGYATDEDGYITGIMDMTEDDRSKLEAAINSYWNGDPGKIVYYKGILNNKLKFPWEKACYGMSIVTILDKLGYIAFNENFSDASTINGVIKPLNSEKLRSAINSFQFSQYIFTSLSDYYPNTNTDADKTLDKGFENFIAAMQENKPVLFIYSHSQGSHAIVAYNWYVDVSGHYCVEGYDNENASRPVEIIIESDFSQCTVSGNIVRSMYFVSDFSFYKDYFDYDGNANDMNISYTSTTANYLNDNKTIIIVEGACNYVVENAEGEKLMFNNCDITGNMEVYDIDIIVAGYGRVVYKYIVNQSSSFTVNCDKGCCKLLS